MNEPPRFLDQDDDRLKRMILRSSELDVPSARSLRRAHAVALGLASSTVASVGAAAGGGVTAGAMLGSASLVKTIAVWLGVGLTSGAVVSGTAATLLDVGTRSETNGAQVEVIDHQRSVPANTPEPPGAVARANTTEVTLVESPAAATPHRASDPVPANPPGPDRSRAARALDSVSRAPPANATTRETAAGRDAVAREPGNTKTSASEGDELARELGMVDRARSALRSGNAASALEQVSHYEQTYERPRFGPEASAIRIEALIARGQRAEAAQLARRFMANYPGHPLTLRLREFLEAEAR